MKYFLLNVEELKLLHAIKMGGNLKTVANNLHLSQGGLSLQLKKLEFKVNSKILERNKNPITFTPTGELILLYVIKLLHLYNEADKAILYFKILTRTNLTIGGNQSISMYLLPKIITLFCRKYSQAQIKLTINYSHCLCWSVLNGQIDIAIVAYNEIPKQLYTALHITPYFEEEFILIFSSSYNLEGIKEFTKENLSKLDFITIKPSFRPRHFTNGVITKADIKGLKVKLELNSIEAIKYAVQSGLGVSLISSMLVKEEIFSNRLKAVKINNLFAKRKLTIIANIKNNDSYLAEQFYDYCSKLCLFNPS